MSPCLSPRPHPVFSPLAHPMSPSNIEPMSPAQTEPIAPAHDPSPRPQPKFSSMPFFGGNLIKKEFIVESAKGGHVVAPANFE